MTLVTPPMIDFNGYVIATPDYVAAKSTKITDTKVSPVSNVPVGPFTPDLNRAIWLTAEATAAASGTIQVFRSTDAGNTLSALTVLGKVVGLFTFSNASGTLINEIIGAETVTGGSWYVKITLTAGTVKLKIEQ